MREHGKKAMVLVDGKMVRFAQRAQYDAWEKLRQLEIDSRAERMRDGTSRVYTHDEFWSLLEADFERDRLRGLITRKRKHRR